MASRPQRKRQRRWCEECGEEFRLNWRATIHYNDWDHCSVECWKIRNAKDRLGPAEEQPKLLFWSPDTVVRVLPNKDGKEVRHG